MNGRRAKQIRKAQGISIAARRDEAAFARIIAGIIIEKAERSVLVRARRRRVLAWVGLAAAGAVAAWGVVVASRGFFP